MSGGFFEYNQYRITDIIDGIERELEKQGQLKPKELMYHDDTFYEKYPEERYYQTYLPEIQEKFKEAIRTLKIAQVYAHRIDWYLSGDDGEENFLKRLKDDLNTIE